MAQCSELFEVRFLEFGKLSEVVVNVSSFGQWHE